MYYGRLLLLLGAAEVAARLAGLAKGSPRSPRRPIRYSLNLSLSLSIYMYMYMYICIYIYIYVVLFNLLDS